jgi:nucleotide-binding universal stress UspA family protein
MREVWPYPPPGRGRTLERMNPIPPGSIVVAADGSADADRAVQWAAEQAFLERRLLVVLTVARPIRAAAAGAGVGAAYLYPVEDLLDGARDIAQAAVDLAGRHRPGLDVDGVAVLGEPSAAIVDHTSDAHLLALGSRGRGRVSSKVLGSVSASVIRHATCPVVVCRPGSDLKVKNGVVVGADATAESLPVIDFAFRQAALRSQPLSILHCHSDELAIVGGPGGESQRQLDREAGRLALAESIAGFREEYPDVHTTTRVAEGTAADGLAAIADHYNLVVTGRHPVGSLSRRLATTTATSVLERSRTVIAVVPEAGSDG